MSDIPRDRTPPPSDEIVPDDRVHAALRRAAQLQAEAAERLEQRTRLLAGETESEAGAGGVTRANLEAAAAEAGISPEYLRQALVEQDALGEHAEELAPWVERASNRILRSRQRTIEMSRTIRAAPADVLETMKRIFPAHPYLLTLVDLVGDDPLNGGVLVFEIPRYTMTNVNVSQLSYTATAADLAQLHVTLRDVGAGGAPACEVTFRGDLRRGVRRNVAFGLGTMGVAGTLGALIGTAVGFASGLALPLLATVAGGALTGGLGSLGYGAAYRHYLRRLNTEMETLLKILDTGTRTAGGFATPAAPPSASASAATTINNLLGM